MKVILICIADPSEFRLNKLNPKNRDCNLADKGLQQCENLQDVANELNVHTVFVSPMKRALLTAYHVFRNHPNFDSIKFVVVPQMREKLKSVWDIPGDTAELIRDFSRKFKNFDFSLLCENKKKKKKLAGEQAEEEQVKLKSMIKLIYDEVYGTFTHKIFTSFSSWWQIIWSYSQHQLIL